MNVKPLAPSLGAAVTGVDLAALDPTKVQAILNAWAQNLVLVFPGQALTDDELAEFSRSFGRLDVAPPVETTQVDGYGGTDLRELTVISNVVINGKPIGAL